MITQLTLIYLFSYIGVVDTLYLIYHKIRGTDVACWFFPDEWCYKVQHASQSRTFGIPNSVAGFCMYLAIIVSVSLFILGNLPFWVVQAIIAFGFCFSMYFLYVQAFVLKAFCTWCVISIINFTVMFIAAFLLR